jgi:hypothetical protein
MLAFWVARTGTFALAVPSMRGCSSDTLYNGFYVMTKVTFVRLSDLSD